MFYFLGFIDQRMFQISIHHTGAVTGKAVWTHQCTVLCFASIFFLPEKTRGIRFLIGSVYGIALALGTAAAQIIVNASCTLFRRDISSKLLKSRIAKIYVL